MKYKIKRKSETQSFLCEDDFGASENLGFHTILALRDRAKEKERKT